MRSLELKEQLENVKTNILENFVDPIPNEMLIDFITCGSKFIRSTLTILYLKSNNCKINDSIYNILAAGEIIHNASLLHDDVIDDADFRRNKITLSKQFSPKISILAGDYLISFATEKILKLNDPEIISLFKDCTKNMAKAEIKQFFLREKLPSQEEYTNICEGKTAKLFSTILRSCAKIANCDPETAEQFGKLYGICFQIKNDLNIESAITDFKNNIFTAKDILGIEKTGDLLDNYKEEMRNILKNFPNNIYKIELEGLVNSL